MTISTLLQTLLALTLIYALLSILVSLLNEFYRSLINSRGKALYAEISTMISDHFNLDYAYIVYTHPVINQLPRENKNSKPGWIDAKTFATALIQSFADMAITLNKADPGTDILQRFSMYVNSMQESKLKDMLRNYLQAAAGDYGKLEASIMSWFTNHMTAMSIDYKRQQRKGLRFFAIVITLFLNLDSIYLIKRVIQDPTLRQNLDAQAQPLYNQYKPLVDSLEKRYSPNAPIVKNTKQFMADVKMVKKETDSLGLPLGWNTNDAPLIWLTKERHEYARGERNHGGFGQWILYFIGLMISAFSLSRGAPFWFELLGKFINIRRGGAKS